MSTDRAGGTFGTGRAARLAQLSPPLVQVIVADEELEHRLELVVRLLNEPEPHELHDDPPAKPRPIARVLLVGVRRALDGIDEESVQVGEDID